MNAKLLSDARKALNAQNRRQRENARVTLRRRQEALRGLAVACSTSPHLIVDPAFAKSLLHQRALFAEMEDDAKAYHYEPDFRRQLKGRLLWDGVLTQIIKESTIAPFDFVNSWGKPIRNLGNRTAEVARNIASAAYYKVGARPWKLANVRPGVCYIGLVYKNDERSADPSAACCAAQMFLDSGDGVVFKGRVGRDCRSRRLQPNVSDSAGISRVTRSQRSRARLAGCPTRNS